MAINHEERARELQAFLDNLPPDSATQAAIDFGVDIDLFARNLLLTPTQRVAMVAVMNNFTVDLQESSRKRLLNVKRR